MPKNITAVASTEELLKPRYKVITHYPNSPFLIGTILHPEEPITDPLTRTIHLYPHLFKPLAWWEERKLEEMPKYIRLNQIMVVEVEKHFCQTAEEFQARDTKYNYTYRICKPASKEEYEQCKTK